MRYRDFLKAQLKNQLPEDIQLPSGFHVVGHVALVHLNSSLREYASIIGEATISFDDRIKSVAIRAGPTSGEKRRP
ncbi:MAG: hypothetical protein RTV31_16190, partial [Candidatus Thorarchaeota archaeon]